MKRITFALILSCLSEFSFAQNTFPNPLNLHLTNPMSVSSRQIEGDYSKIQLPMVMSQDGSPVLNLKPYTKELERAAKNGDAAAMVEVGKCYLFGNGVDENNKKAQKWFEEAIELNNADALFWMGYMYEKGKAKKIVSASFFTKLGMERGAIRSLANEELEARNKAAESLYNKATIYNQPDAWFWRYCQARAKGESFNQALIAAAEGGNMKAQYEYGAYFLNQYKSSPATTSHLTTAKEWFSKAAEQGHPDAAKVVSGIEDAERQIEIAKREAQERARQEALEAARRDSIQRVQAEQQRRQDSIDIAIGRKLPPKRMLIDGCNTYIPPRNEFFSYDFERSNYFTLFKALCDNDVLAYYGKDKLDDLDKTVYKNSEQYKSDLAFFQKKKTEKYALAYPFGSNAEWKFFADGFSFESWKHTTTDFASNIRPNYMGFMSLLIPVLSSQTKLNDLQQYFKCTDLEKLQQVRSMKSDLELLYIFKPGMTVTTIINTYSTHYAYFTNPIGLYLVNRNTGETILDLSYCLRKTGFSNDKQRIEAAAKADYKKRQQAQERNKPKYHSTAKPVQCSVCLGRGVTVGSPEKINGVWVSEKRCYFCNGRGYTMEHYY